MTKKHWKETLITNKELCQMMKWPHTKIIEDGKLDMIITVPLTTLLEIQAKRAYANGMLTMMDFHIQKQNENKLITVEDLGKLFKAQGLPELAKYLGDVAKEKES